MNRNLIVEEFNKYVKDYDAANPKIALKIAHTIRVASISQKIGESLLLSNEEADTAWAIGMLHDIGRFEQVRRYNTFDDSRSVNHAELGVNLLFQEGLIKTFDIEEKDYDLIKIAISNHNRYRIQEGLSEKKVMFCKIIRDADKIDILRVNYETPMEEIYNTTEEVLRNDKISDAVYSAFFKESAISHSLKETYVDRLIGHISLVFELEYPISYEILKESGYLEKLLSFKSNNEETNQRLNIIREYMSQKLK